MAGWLRRAEWQWSGGSGQPKGKHWGGELANAGLGLQVEESQSVAQYILSFLLPHAIAITSWLLSNCQ